MSEFTPVPAMESSFSLTTSQVGALIKQWGDRALIKMKQITLTEQYINQMPKAATDREKLIAGEAFKSGFQRGMEPNWIKVSDQLPICRHECTSSCTNISDTVYVYGTDKHGDIARSFAHYQDDGKWIFYGGDYDFMLVETATHWTPLFPDPTN